jgi:hypothetical protein
MVFNKTFAFACLLGLIATSVAFPAAERAEAAVDTTVRSLNDDIGEDAAVTATTEQVVLADEVPATTELNVRSDNVETAPVEPEQNNVIAVEEVVVPVEKTAPVVVAEVIETNNNAGPAVVEVVEVIPVNNNVKSQAAGTAPITAAATGNIPQPAPVAGSLGGRQ